jgi:hypothetical protein
MRHRDDRGGAAQWASPAPLGIQSFDPRWTLPSVTERNPLVWMAEVDLQVMPREVQEIAFEDGLVPYIPADRQSRS